MKFAIAAFMAVAASAANLTNQHKFMQYLADQGKSYITVEEFNARFELFQATEQMIIQHNTSQDDYWLVHNKFSDMTEAERSEYLGHIQVEEDDEDTVFAEIDVQGTPSSVDWRSSGAVQKAKDQKACASCWAFSAVCVVESAYKIKHGQLPNLAEQQLVDCTRNDTYNESGCSGGNIGRAFSYFKDYYAIKQGNYPYTHTNGSCQYNNLSHTQVKVKDTVSITHQSVSAIKSQVAKGPIGTTVFANSAFQNYGGGMFNDTSCKTSGQNHGVNIVGYGNDDGNYYIVRSSWGPTWGDNGFMKLRINGDGPGICGVQGYPISATVV